MPNQSLFMALLLSVGLLSAVTAGGQESKETNGDQETELLSLDQVINQQQEVLKQLSDAKKGRELLTQEGALDKKKMDEAQKALESATALYVTDKTAANLARIKNARFKSVLAKRRFKKYSVRQTKLNQQVLTLEQQLSSYKLEMNKLLAQQKSLPSQTSPVTAKLNSPIQKQTLPQTAGKPGDKAGEKSSKKLTSEETKAEIARLSALLNKQEAAKPGDKPLAKTQTLAVLTAVDEVQDIVELNAQSRSTSKANDLQSSYTNLSDLNLTDDGVGNFRFLTSKNQVIRTERQLRLLLEKRSLNWSTFDKMIIAKDSKGASISYPLRTLGHDQFRSTIRLSPGTNLLIIGFNRWQFTMPENFKDGSFVVTMNNSDPDRPELVFYSTTLQ